MTVETIQYNMSVSFAYTNLCAHMDTSRTCAFNLTVPMNCFTRRHVEGAGTGAP